MDQTYVASGLKKLKRMKKLSVGKLKGKDSTKELNSMSMKDWTMENYHT